MLKTCGKTTQAYTRKISNVEDKQNETDEKIKTHLTSVHTTIRHLYTMQPPVAGIMHLDCILDSRHVYGRRALFSK